jgi:hypothetical protein
MRMDAISSASPLHHATARVASGPPVSAAIGLARLICILGIVYVHAWTGLGGDRMAMQAGSGQDILRWSLVELFGRSAVPLLSIVSGWLVARSVGRRGYGQFVRGKARAILAPMVVWNIIAIVLVVGAGALHWVVAPLLGDGLWLADNIFNLTRAGDINVQMAFMRDLFLCMLAAPLLVKADTRWLVLLVAAVAVWVVGNWQLAILLRPSILMFFTLGIVARRQGWAERLATIPLWQAVLPFALIVPFKILLSVRAGEAGAYEVHFVALVDLATRGAAALVAWRAAIALAGTAIGQRFGRLEPFAFFLFCSHLLFMWLLAPAIGDHLTGAMGQPLWPLFFLLQPALAMIFAIGLAKAIQLVSPETADLLSGGRLRRPQAASPAARPLAHAH